MVTVVNNLHAKFMRWLIRRDREGKRLGLFRDFLPRTMDGVLQMEYNFSAPVPNLPPRSQSLGQGPKIYGKTSGDLVTQYLKKPDSLTPKEMHFLGDHATYEDRRLLELKLEPNHPLLQAINEQFRIKTKKGFELVL